MRPRASRSAGRLKQDTDFAVTFWGVRGSIPSPGARTQRYGGNTSCVEMRVGGQHLIFDLGTGARALGEQHFAQGWDATFFLSHYHYDHLQGFPFFTPLFDPLNRFTLYGPTRDRLSVRNALFGQMTAPYFPVTAEMVIQAQVDFKPIRSGAMVELGPVRVDVCELHHPGKNLGYRVSLGGRSAVYATDYEHLTPPPKAFRKLVEGCDLLIYDAMYTEEEYRGEAGPSRRGWGHSTWQAGVALARAAQVKQLVLFHHAPTRSDAQVDAILRQARRFHPNVIAAREGQTISL